MIATTILSNVYTWQTWSFEGDMFGASESDILLPSFFNQSQSIYRACITDEIDNFSIGVVAMILRLNLSLILLQKPID